MKTIKLAIGIILILGFGVSALNAQTEQTVKDIDGNVYKTVKIGNQIWMAENLKVTKYRNGNPIPNVTDNTAWSLLTTGASCDYNNTPTNSTTYGKLYNWFAASDSRNIAPTGWHVATDADWKKLTEYLGGEETAGGKLKETGTTHWKSPNNNATNESGFRALPGGTRTDNGGFGANLGIIGQYWCSTEMAGVAAFAWYYFMGSDNGTITRGGEGKKMGYSIRCVKD